MAANSCSLTCNVKDAKGKVKVSALWKALDKFFKGDRRDAITHYFLTKDNNFLLENSDVLEFDADGEVTIASLKKALERDGEYSNLSNGRILRHLNDEIAGKYSYSEALDNVLKFNRSHQFREGFMATLKPVERGKYSVEVVERNPSTEAELIKHVENKLQSDAVQTLLKNQGLSVEFMENPKYYIRYSSGNLVEGADGLMAVGQVMSGSNSAIATAEVAGHFIVGAMRDNQLVSRLMNQLTPEVQEALFKNPKSELYREDFIVSSDSSREAAGILVGKGLLSPFRDTYRKKYSIENLPSSIIKSIKWLVDKIANFSKKILGIYTPDVVSRLAEEAKTTASTVAQGYLSNPEQANIDNIINTSETYAVVRSSKYLSDGVNKNVQAFKETIGYLKDTVNRLRDIAGRSESKTNKDILKNLQSLYKNVIDTKANDLDLEVFAKNASIEGMIYTIENITSILDSDVRMLLDSVQPSDRVGSYTNIVENARNMRTVETIVRNMAQLYLVMSDKISDLDAAEPMQFQDNDGNQVVGTLREALSRLDAVLGANDEIYEDAQSQEQVVHGLRRLMELKSRQVWSDFAENIYGKDYIERNAGVVWAQVGSEKKLIRSDKIRGYNQVKYKDWIASMDEDISIIDRFVRSASDCGDFLTATGYKISRNANMQADRITERFWNEGEALRQQMKEIFGTTDCTFLYETITDENGVTSKTGNILSQVNHGAWENDRRQFSEELKKGFNEYLSELRKKAYEVNKNTPGYVFAPSDFQMSVLYHNYVTPLWAKWHEEHSEEDKSFLGSKKMIPNHIKYYNPEWDRFFDVKNPSLSSEEKAERERRLKWYNSLIEMKQEIDSMLPVNSTVFWRMPQFTGNSYHRFNNLKARMGNSLPAFGSMLRKKAQDLVVVRQDEAYLFGSNNEFNEIESDPLENNMYFEKEKVDRLPLFGINKLKDMADLSTDLFGNMTRYASMAANYKALSMIVDIAELGANIIDSRKVGGVVESERKSESRAKTRYMKFLKNNIYGIHVTPIKWNHGRAIMKLGAAMSRWASKMFLGGNAVGGAVNTGTGMIEIFKEAVSGEYFSTTDAVQAHKMYFDGLLNSDGYMSSFTNMLTNPLRPMDKNSLWIRYWNITGKNKEFYRGQKYDTHDADILKLNHRLWDWYDHVIWLPYSSGDHYMQCIPAYALGIHEKVYDRTGKKINLIDAYEVVDGEDVYAVGDTERKKSIGKTYKKLQLKDEIFRNTSDISKYDTVIGMINKTSDFFDSHPNIKNNNPLALNFFSEEEINYLKDEGFNIPDNVKKLQSLKNALSLKASELKYNENDESAFMDKCRNITNRLHGIYNSEDKTTMHQNFFGNLFLAMKGYALGYIGRNFSENYYNTILGKTTEGSYNTFAKVLAMSFLNFNDTDNWKRVSEALLLTIPVANIVLFNKNFNNKLKANMLKEGFSENQFYNMRRVGINFFVIETLWLLGALTALKGPFGLEDDDKEVSTSENPAIGLMYYLFTRWNIEQRAYAEPFGMWKESEQLLSIPTGFSGFGRTLDMAQLFVRTRLDKMIGEPDLENSELYYQTSKEDKYEVGDEKWWKQFQRYIPYFRNWYTLQHPYDAVSSYEYGRRVRK